MSQGSPDQMPPNPYSSTVQDAELVYPVSNEGDEPGGHSLQKSCGFGRVLFGNLLVHTGGRIVLGGTSVRAGHHGTSSSQA